MNTRILLILYIHVTLLKADFASDSRHYGNRLFAICCRFCLLKDLRIKLLESGSSYLSILTHNGTRPKDGSANDLIYIQF